MTSFPLDTDINTSDETFEIQEYLAGIGAKLIKANGSVLVSIGGSLVDEDGTVPYALVPSNGTLAKVSKWSKLSTSAKLALVKERFHAESVAEAEREVGVFVARAKRLAIENGIEPARCWSGLIAPTELAGRRFEVIEARIIAAGVKYREKNSAAKAKGAVSLSLYPESFPLAPKMKRKFIAVLGPTNSGKTYEAMEALTKAKNGVYLAPLRLLALENYERMVESGLAVSLITGEERRVFEGATHIASTIEMLDLKREVEVAIIDEIQMLEDRDRGSAWTAAVCGVPAHVVYLVGSLSARAAIEALVKRLGCELEVRILARKSPLVVEDKPVTSVGDLRKGDALIAFSRREVLSWRDQLQAKGLSVAVIYGSLSPETRRAQAKRFRDGLVDVLVATDAVGMGLNLPVSRIVFMTASKFDGVSDDILPAWLAQQIGGRAGRYGLHEVGYVAGWEGRTHYAIRKLMSSPLESQPVRGFLVAPTLDHLLQISAATGENRLANLLALFTQHIDVHDEFFLPANLQEQKERALWLDQLPLSLEDRFLFASVPISTKVPHLQSAWESWARSVAVNKKSRAVLERFDNSRNPLLEAEDACKKYSAYAWLAYRLPALFPDGEAAVTLARHTSTQIDTMLQAQNSRAKALKAAAKPSGGATKQTTPSRGQSPAASSKNGRSTTKANVRLGTKGPRMDSRP